MNIVEPIMVIRIDVSMLNEPQVVEEVVYYRADLKMSRTLRWKWYFEYLAARIKVKHPKRTVRLQIIQKSADLKLGDEYIAQKSRTLIKAKRAQIAKLENDHTTDLFSFAELDRADKICRLRKEISALERGEFPYYYPFESKNVIKQWI